VTLAAQQGEMKEFIQLTFSFCFLVCLLDRGHIISIDSSPAFLIRSVLR